MLLVSAAPLYAQLGKGGHPSNHDHHGASVGGWEGSVQGMAYSEFNLHLVGLFVLLMGCAELRQALHLPSLLWGQASAAGRHAVRQCHSPDLERP